MIHLRRSKLQGLTSDNPDLDAVKAALQDAIELEHATIPVYLYALYSLDERKNQLIAEILSSVVVEEMLHMTLASNVLNAIGGSPVIDKPGFIPTYPGPLPGGVDSKLTVNLAPFSPAQLQAFLDIEQPEHPLEFPTLKAVPDDSITIGQFYTAISDAIAALGEGIFAPPPRHQVGPDLMNESVVVVNVATAQQAIDTIIEQGEGTTTSPEEGVGRRVAHYYRFMQIQKGRLLIPISATTPPKYAYAGPEVKFDASGVYAVPTNPALPPGYPPSSVQAFANDNFNYTYTSLLFLLHGFFNGEVSQAVFNRAIGLMMSLKGQAKAMMAGIPDASVLTGPSFQYQPVNPKAAKK
jgi:Ferritin-like